MWYNYYGTLSDLDACISCVFNNVSDVIDENSFISYTTLSQSFILDAC